MSNDNSLIHFGVKGMKWGIKKAPDKRAIPRLSRKEARLAKDTAEAEKRRELARIDKKADLDTIKEYYVKRAIKDKARYQKEIKTIKEWYETQEHLTAEDIAKERRIVGTQLTGLMLAVIGASIITNTVRSKYLGG